MFDSAAMPGAGRKSLVRKDLESELVRERMFGAGLKSQQQKFIFLDSAETPSGAREQRSRRSRRSISAEEKIAEAVDDSVLVLYD